MTYVYASVREERKVDVYAIYTEAVTYEGATASEDPDEVPWIRNPELVAYLNRQIEEERARGRTITEIAKAGDISRTQFNRWRGVGGPQSIPDADNLVAVCVGNGWPPAEPLRILGWDGSSSTADDAEIRSAVGSLLEVLRDEDLDDADAEEALAQLRMLETLLRARAERRRRNRDAK
jgi:hypothetical protein